MKAPRADWISLVEAGYCLEGDDQQWIDKVFERAIYLLEPTGFVDAWTYTVTPSTFVLGLGRTSPGYNALRKKIHQAIPSSAIDVLYRSPWAVATLSEHISPLLPQQLVFSQIISNIVGQEISDVWGLKCSSGNGSGVIFAVALAECRNSTANERKRWSQVASHLGAGLRLRKLAQELSQESSLTEPVFDPWLYVQDAPRHAVDTKAREALRRAVRNIEQGRARSDDDPDAALHNWRDLVSGRCSLVDHFDADGKRFIVALKNDPAHPDPRGLTQGERNVAETIGAGYATKEIADAFGVSDAAVNNAAARIQTKLRLSSRAEVASFFAANGPCATFAEVALKDERLLMGAYPLLNPESAACLTETEREVAALIIAGFTNRDIAKRRGLSEHTIANQTQSIFLKLNVHSRAQLAARLQTREPRR